MFRLYGRQTQSNRANVQNVKIVVDEICSLFFAKSPCLCTGLFWSTRRAGLNIYQRFVEDSLTVSRCRFFFFLLSVTQMLSDVLPNEISVKLQHNDKWWKQPVIKYTKGKKKKNTCICSMNKKQKCSKRCVKTQECVEELHYVAAYAAFWVWFKCCTLRLVSVKHLLPDDWDASRGHRVVFTSVASRSLTVQGPAKLQKAFLQSSDRNWYGFQNKMNFFFFFYIFRSMFHCNCFVI